MINKRTYLQRVVSAALWLLLTTSGSSAGAGDRGTPASVVPDAKIQADIRQVLRTGNEDDRSAKEALGRLNQLAFKKPEVLAPQVLHAYLPVTDEKEGWRVLGLMKSLGSRWDTEMRRGLIPLLETRDEKTRQAASSWLAGIDGFGRIDPAESILSYRETLLRQKDTPPGLVDYLFDHAPGKALLLFGEIHSEKPQIALTWPRDLLWADHLLTTVQWRLRHQFLQDGDLQRARQELDKLSRHDGWYARRYAVEVLRRSPPLATPELAERLRKDRHPLVREAAAALKSP